MTVAELDALLDYLSDADMPEEAPEYPHAPTLELIGLSADCANHLVEKGWDVRHDQLNADLVYTVLRAHLVNGMRVIATATGRYGEASR